MPIPIPTPTLSRPRTAEELLRDPRCTLEDSVLLVLPDPAETPLEAHRDADGDWCLHWANVLVSPHLVYEEPISEEKVRWLRARYLARAEWLIGHQGQLTSTELARYRADYRLALNGQPEELP